MTPLYPHGEASWDVVATEYAKEIVPLFRYYAKEALRLAPVVPGMRVLDVATGPGTLAFEAAEAGAQVSALDFSPRMIGALHERMSANGSVRIEASVGDGETLTFADDTFHVAFSMFGLAYFPDRVKGLQELRRVLRPEGLALISSWASMKDNPFMVALESSLRVAMPLLLLFSRQLPLAQPGELKRELATAGFRDAEVHTVSHGRWFLSPGEAWTWVSRLLPPLVKIRGSIREDTWRAISDRILKELTAALGQDRIWIELPALLGLGYK